MGTVIAAIPADLLRHAGPRGARERASDPTSLHFGGPTQYLPCSFLFHFVDIISKANVVFHSSQITLMERADAGRPHSRFPVTHMRKWGMLSRINSYLIKSTFIAAIVFAMSSQADAFWYWYAYPTYRPVYYSTYRPVYYSTYRPAYYTTYYTPACGPGCSSACSTCNLACNPCGCSPCRCAPCGDGCSVSSASEDQVSQTARTARPTVAEENLAPSPLGLDENAVALRVAPTRQRTRVEAAYRVPHIARLETAPEATPQSAWQPVREIETHVASR